MRMQSLGHVVLKVRDLERSVPFYTEVLGFKEVARNERKMVFFSIEDNHHDLAIAQTNVDAPAAPDDAPGLAHLAFKIGDSLDELRAAKTWLEANGVDIHHMSDHTVTQSIYFCDPDDNLLEVFVEADPRLWRGTTNRVASRQPLEL
jgi:catechol 2,3-dioxygenase